MTDKLPHSLDTAVFILGTYDPTNLFLRSDLVRMQLVKSYELKSYVVETVSQLCNRLADAQHNIFYGRRIDMLAIQAHGAYNEIRLGESGNSESSLYLNNLDKITNCFKEHLTKNAPVLLLSCDTGKDVANSTNIATKIAITTGHPVQAPTQGIYASDRCPIYIDKKTRYPWLNCERSIVIDNEKTGVYTQLFNPYTTSTES